VYCHKVITSLDIITIVVIYCNFFYVFCFSSYNIQFTIQRTLCYFCLCMCVFGPSYSPVSLSVVILCPFCGPISYFG